MPSWKKLPKSRLQPLLDDFTDEQRKIAEEVIDTIEELLEEGDDENESEEE